MRLLRLLVSLAALAPLVAGSPVFAQAAGDTGPRLSGSFGGSFGDGGSTIATGGAAAYRFTRHVGIEFEVLYIPSLEFTDNAIVPLALPTSPAPAGLLAPVPFRFEVSGRAVAFLTKFVAEFPTPLPRLRPYVAWGGGVANVSERIDFSIAGPGILTVGTLIGSLTGQPIGLIFPPFRESETDLALSTGGGLDFQLWRGLAVGADVRYLHLFGRNEDFNLTQLGTRVSYRF